MRKFDVLTKYLGRFQKGEIGHWVTDDKKKESPEDPIQFSYVQYSEIVTSFIKDVYAFIQEDKEYRGMDYRTVLMDNAIELNSESIMNVDVSKANALCIFALILWALRAERFSEGALLEFFEKGAMDKWLERLSQL